MGGDPDYAIGRAFGATDLSIRATN